MRAHAGLGAAITAALTLLLSRPGAAQPYDLRTVLERARVYLSAYHDELATVIAEEDYNQKYVRSRMPNWPLTRRLRSEYLLLRGDDLPSGWLGFRDVMAVDGKPVRDRAGRLESLLKSARGDLRRNARAIAEESARFNLGSVLRTINVPTMALEFLSAENQSRVKTKKAAERTTGGAALWVIEFEETGSPTLIRGEKGGDVRARGGWWIEPGTGRVTRTELYIEKPVRSDITVVFGRDERLGIWVPTEMRENYRTPDGMITGDARYGKYRRFETGARIIGEGACPPDCYTSRR